jgi:hypothetical protein
MYGYFYFSISYFHPRGVILRYPFWVMD